jgi:hypothetical protein
MRCFPKGGLDAGEAPKKFALHASKANDLEIGKICGECIPVCSGGHALQTFSYGLCRIGPLISMYNGLGADSLGRKIDSCDGYGV